MRTLVKKIKLRLLVREESGFTLVEVLVAMLMMITVLFALHAIFDMSLRVFSFGNDKVEAVENARVALERMEREIRAAYPLNPPTANQVLDLTSNAGQITFYNDLNGDGKGNGTGENIGYYVSGTNLMRSKGSVPNTITTLGSGGSLEFKYYHRLTGAEITNLSTNEPNVGMVRIRLVVSQDGRKQELITNVALRNRGA